jgi:hypothetical protein
LEPGKSDQYQEDADRRDKAIAMDKSWRPQLIKRKPPYSLPEPGSESRTWQKDQARRYGEMQVALGNIEVSPKPETGTSKPCRPKKSHKIQSRPSVNIAGISPAAFQINLRKKENLFFTISFFEIDKELESRQEDEFVPGEQQPGETELQWLARVLPEEFKDFADVFSKEASNVLPPYRPYNHKIQIDDPKGPESLGYSPLRQQSTYEL